MALGGLLAWLGYRAQLLLPGGAIAVLLAMIIISLTGGWVWSLALLVTLASIGFWARFRRRFKRTISERFRERARLGWWQILARIGWPVVLALLYGLLTPERGVFAFRKYSKSANCLVLREAGRRRRQQILIVIT